MTTLLLIVGYFGLLAIVIWLCEKYTVAVVLGGIFLLVALAQAQGDAPPSSSILKGLVEGCIDGQRRLHAEQKIAFDGELVRHYCHCQAENMADLMPDAEARNKLRLKDPKMVAAVKASSAACMDGVRQGRRFAPLK